MPANIAVRGGLVDLFPSGEEQALRLDFFGDEIESVRRFDPATQRTTGTDRGLHPAARLRDPARRGQRQALPLALPRAVRRHRDRRPALPGGVATAGASPASTTGCPCSRSGWRRCSIISATTTSSSATPATAARPKRGSRRSPTITRTASARSRNDPGSYRPLEPETLYLAPRRMGRADRRAADPSRHAVPRAGERHASSTSRSTAARDFAPERAQGANVYEAVVEHVAGAAPRQAQGRARQLFGRRARAAEGPARRPRPDAGAELADSWQEALGAAAKGQVALVVLRSTTASPPPTSRCSPSRTCSATGWSAAASARRAPTPSSPSWRRSRPATSSSTPTTASAATRG